jgi:hypothetical protein
MDCPNCGAYNASSSFRCRRCGHVLQPDAEGTDRSSFDETSDTGADDASWTPAEEPVYPWRSDQPAEPEPSTNPWSYSEPGQSDQAESWDASQQWDSTDYERWEGASSGAGFTPPPDIPNYLWQSIAVTLCCCWPIGIPAIVYASRVNAFVSSGDYTRAQETSEKAKNWVLASFIAGLVIYLGFICLTLASG